MKFGARKAAGSVPPSADSRQRMMERAVLVPLSLLLVVGAAWSQSMYKYRGPDGEWIYTDRAPPATLRQVEVRVLERGYTDPEVKVFHRIDGNQITLHASNEFHAPIEMVLGLDELRNVSLPPPGQSLRFLVPPQREMVLLTFTADEGVTAPLIAYRYQYLVGDPEAEHDPPRPYRVPYAIASRHTVSQAFPYATTHTTADSMYAVDISMPIGTNIYAARDGIVFEVASTNFKAGLDPEVDGDLANVVRILHDDGTYSVYAHLNWNTIRVRPGDEVRRGQYIADSGNTGFSTGPHLHFAVIRNAGMKPESLPIVFEGRDGTEVTAERGAQLIAY